MMNPKTQKALNLEQMIWKQGQQDYKVDKWLDDINQFEIKFAPEFQIADSKDGLLKDQLKQTSSKNPENSINLEQIQHLQWQGEYGPKNTKLGKWIATWYEEVLREVCGYNKKEIKILYYQNGLKQGLWREPIKNFWSQAQVYESGQYCNDKKCGTWIYIHENKKMYGGGQYNEQGLKDWKWIEVSDESYCNSQVSYNGEYKKGKKVGLWDIMFKDKQIGGGLYNEDGIKIGKWIDLSYGDNEHLQVIYNGEYKYGKKVGRWKILCRKEHEEEFQYIGGGLYDEGCDGIKIGRWIEVSEGFNEYSQVTYGGVYKFGKKVGRWDILYRKEFEEEFNQIGGGLYDGEGYEIKIGKWIDITEEFNEYSQVTYRGEYKNGIKFGRWDTWFRNEYRNGEFKQIGGGLYDEQVNGIKIGRWVELSERFQKFAEVTYSGVYKFGKKVGRWDILYRKEFEEEFNQIGGGFYNEEGYEIKIGKWIDITEEFNEYSQVTYSGEYKNGIKFGRWDTWFRNEYRNGEFKQIGGGLYDEQGDGIKIGRWIEQKEGFYSGSQVIIHGEYINGRKIGIWEEMKNM